MTLTDISSARPSHTLNEILSQPDCWRECLRQLPASEDFAKACKLANPAAEFVLIGCGSSYYLAMAAAATFHHLGLRARAVPASEILLYPEQYISKARQYLPVLISRSGVTSEVVNAARFLQKETKIPAVAITCAERSPLESLVTTTLKLPAADEKSMVMTRSFTSMLLGLQYFAATLVTDEKFRDALLQLPDKVSPLIHTMPTRLQDFVRSCTCADFVFLAQGPLFGVANEAMLKTTEASRSYTQVFHSMEFRHGPKSIAGPETLIVFFISESSYDAEVQLLVEMQKLGSPIVAVANVLDARVRKAADFSIELSLEVPEYARSAAYTIWGQLMGVYTGMKKGLNPDAPTNLSRAVVLDRNQG
jgi:glutamine---fructose-6-phosphate transaminase (isomerizing)